MKAELYDLPVLGGHTTFSTFFVKCVTNITGMSEEEITRLSKESVERIAALEGYTAVWDELNKNSTNNSNSTPSTPQHVHDYTCSVTKETTCTEEGVKTYTCSGCGKSYTKTIPKTDHKWEETITKEPTCTEVGIKTFTCKKCCDTYTEEIPALGHNETSAYVYKAKIGNLVFDGKTVYTCQRCGEVREETDPNTYSELVIVAINVGHRRNIYDD